MSTSASAGAWAYRSLSEPEVGFKWGLVLGLAVSWASRLLVAYVGPPVRIPSSRDQVPLGLVQPVRLRLL
ncbi:MAG: hypothetical protein JRN06_07015 [Nitrososphaerota archaeon]|nr:hypothetical protein [Nitrososphaerota archaeon]MDG7024469.1 hypothetical protein [Nitrososphaerota archaeon]